ncbi:diacylglycerol kinase family enzyme [Elusimicrobium posterum]|uniref:diacylglycerol/lipid kinase family protein n=1 Tax=Elusimicrobium posterum TaxID=3116653 RepID=UPI003C73705A
MKNKTMLFMNPASKSGKGKKNWKFFEGCNFDVKVTQNADDMAQSVRDFAQNGEDLGGKTAVAVGGDGTINMVLDAIMKSGKKVTLGVLYSGTSPDFCRFHNIPVKPKAALETLLSGRRRMIDICRITYANGGVNYFASGCNIGLGADIAAGANKIRKYFGDLLGTFFAAVGAVLRSKKFEAGINFDGETKVFKNVIHVAILKNNFMASGLHLNIDAKDDDGFLNVVVIEKLNLKSLLGIYKGKIPHGSYVRKCKSVEIKTVPAKLTEYDGDPRPAAPVKIECLNKTLEIIK